MAIKHSAGCSCCFSCEFESLQYVSPTTTSTVADGTSTVLSPVFENYNHYRFSGDLFAGFFGSDATRTMTMEFISEDETTVYDTITWQYNSKWDLYNTEGGCDRGESGDWTFNYKGGFGFEKSNGDQFSIKTEDRELPAASSYVTVSSVSSADSSRDTISSSAGCVVRAYPTGEVDRPCQLDPDSTCPCSSEIKAGEVEWAISHDGWATASGNDSIPAFDMYRFWNLTFDQDSCSVSSNANCSGLTQARTSYVVHNYLGSQSSATQDWADGTQSKQTTATSNAGATASGYGGFVAMTPICTTGHYAQPSTTTSIYHYTDAGSGAFNVSIHQNLVKTTSGSSITLQVVRQAADIACTVVVSVSNGADQTINMGVGELVKNFSVTAPTSTTGKETPDVTDSLATATSLATLNGIRVKEDVIEFEGSGVMVAHGKCMLNTDGSVSNGQWFPLDRKSWGSNNFKIRLTNNGSSVNYSSYDYKLIKNEDLDCYDEANSNCPPEYVCSNKAEYHYNPIEAVNFAGAISSEFPDKLRTEVNGCTTRTIMQDFSGSDLTDKAYGGTRYIHSVNRFTVHQVDQNSIVIPDETAPTDGSYNTPFSTYCFNDGNRYYYQERFVYTGWPSGQVKTVIGYWNIVSGIGSANMTCGTTSGTTSQIDNVTLSNVGTNAFQRTQYWKSISGSFQSNAGSGSGWNSTYHTSGTCDVNGDNLFDENRAAGSSGINSMIIEATLVKPVSSATWPPSIAIPANPTNEVYLSQSPFAGLMFGENSVSGFHDDFLGQTKMYTTADTTLPSLQSSDITDLIDSGATLWVEILNDNDPTDDGYYTLSNNAGTVELNTGSKTATPPTLTSTKVGIDASIVAEHLTHNLLTDSIPPSEVFGTIPAKSNDMTYTHIIGGVSHANGLKATVPTQGSHYQYETGGRAKWLDDMGNVGILGFDGGANTETFVVNTATPACGWNASTWTPAVVLSNNTQWSYQGFDPTLENYNAYSPSPCGGQYVNKGGSLPPEGGTPYRTSEDFLSESHSVYVYDRSGLPTTDPEIWTVGTYTQGIEWTQSFGGSDAVYKACCDGAANQYGTLTGYYFDFSGAPAYTPSFSRWFDRLLETRSELFSINGGYPWGGTYLKESKISMKKKWVDCWDGLPSTLATISYSSSDMVSGAEPIRIFDSVTVDNIRIGGTLDENNDWEYLLADVNVTSTNADFSTLTFDLTGLSW